MRRLVAVTLALVMCGPVSAKTLIVANTAKSTEANFGLGERVARESRLGHITRMLDLFGASYKIIPPAAMKTQWARTGDVTWNFGTSSAYVEHFDAVIHLTAQKKSSGSPEHPGYRPDFLTIGGADSVPRVPQVFMATIDGISALFAGAFSGIFNTTTTCSLGVVANSWDSKGPHDDEGIFYSGTTAGLMQPAMQIYPALQRSTVEHKGISVLLGYGPGAITSLLEPELVYSAWADSGRYHEAPDTAAVYMIRYTNIAGAKPIIVLSASAGIADGAGGLIFDFDEIDPVATMVALAALDSAAGGRVFDNESKLPLKVAITVDGLSSRSSKLNSGGIVPSDTSNFYATIDSMAAYRIPVVFGVNLDSVAVYPRDLQYVKDNYPQARFSPQSRAGLDTTSLLDKGGNNRRHRAVDTFGRYRNQSMAYGPAGGASGDTSLYARLVYALALGDSMWGRGRTSRFALPPDDDWSPYNWRGNQADASRGVTQDSILFAYARAGFRGIRINGSWRVARPHLNPTNPRGYVWRQGRYPTADRSTRINLLAHNGNSTFGVLHYPATADSTVPVSISPSSGEGWMNMHRLWSGLFGTNNGNAVGNGLVVDHNTTGSTSPARIMKFSCQELSGSGVNVSYKESVREGWWPIKAVANHIAIMNRAAGRTIMQVAYPEDIQP